MAEFYGNFADIFQCQYSLQRGWVEYRVGGVKNHRLGYPLSSYDASRCPHNAHAVLVGHRDSGSNFRFPPSNWYSPLVPLFQF